MEKDDLEKFEGTTLEAIGTRLKLTREVLGLTQVALCARTGIATNTYNQYEKGRARPTVENAIAICDAFHLTLDWVYRGDPSGLRYDLAEQIKVAKRAGS